MRKKQSEQLFNVFFPLTVDRQKIYDFVKLMRNRSHNCGMFPDNEFVVQVRCSEKELKEARKHYPIQSIDVLTGGKE